MRFYMAFLNWCIFAVFVIIQRANCNLEPFVLVCCRCAGGPIILFLMGTCILMHSDSTSCCYQLMTNLSLNNIDFAKKRWMKPAWVLFQWKFSGFCGDPVDLVQSMGIFFLVCLLSDNRQAIDQCLIWNPITLQGEQWVWCANPSEFIEAKQGSTSHSDSSNPLPGCKILRSVTSRSCNL